MIELTDEAKAGRLDRDAVSAVLESAGYARPALRGGWPAGLSDREVEVLRLCPEAIETFMRIERGMQRDTWLPGEVTSGTRRQPMWVGHSRSLAQAVTPEDHLRSRRSTNSTITAPGPVEVRARDTSTIIAGAGVELIVTVVAEQRIFTGVADEFVVSCTTVERSSLAACIERVVAGSPDQHVVAGSPD